MSEDNVINFNTAKGIIGEKEAKALVEEFFDGKEGDKAILVTIDEEGILKVNIGGVVKNSEMIYAAKIIETLAIGSTFDED